MKKILVVDDDRGIRDFLKSFLSENGYNVEEARNGLEALEVIELTGGDFDLIISDIRMPKMTGIQLVREMKQSLSLSESALPPIILMSGDKFINYELIEALGAMFIPKPLSLEKILSAVREAVGE